MMQTLLRVIIFALASSRVSLGNQCPFIIADETVLEKMCLTKCPELNLLACDTDVSASHPSVRCVCKLGFRFDAATSTCQDVNECFEGTDDCDGIKGTCSNTEGGFTCGCVAGYERISITHNICGPKALCNKKCKGGRKCRKTVNFFRGMKFKREGCFCPKGSMISDTGCQDIDECRRLTLPPCGSNKKCINEDMTGYRCDCMPGYVANGIQCQDINECLQGAENICGDNEICVNTPGSYTCKCSRGYTRNAESQCQSICEEPPMTIRQYQCKLFKKQSWPVAVNECLEQPCPAGAMCHDQLNGYRCVCPSGYTYNSATNTCDDVDECALEMDDCWKETSGKCENTDGSYTCSCRSGYHGDGLTCSKIGSSSCKNGCTGNKICVIVRMLIMRRFMIKKPTCVCNEGFKIGDYGDCQDINECSHKSPCSENAMCQEKSPGFTCSCNSGFQGNGVHCDDIDECALKQHKCHEDAYCINRQGSYGCQCRPGYIGDGFNCEPLCLDP